MKVRRRGRYREAEGLPKVELLSRAVEKGIVSEMEGPRGRMGHRRCWREPKTASTAESESAMT